MNAPGPAEPGTRQSWCGLWYILPAGLTYLPLVFIPLFYSLALSLYDWDGLAASWRWCGLGNYAEMLRDAIFWKALAHNLWLVIVSLLLQLPAALLLAVLVARSVRILNVVRTCLFVPYVLPMVVVAMVWTQLLNGVNPEWLGSTTWSLPWVFCVTSWRFIGFHLVLYLAGIAAIDPGLYEAARLDGAGAWACLRHITLPLLKPVLVVSITLSVVGSMKFFDIVYVMTGGGPVRSTELLATYMFEQGFSAYRYGYASALAVTLVALALGGMMLVHLVARRRRWAG